ncbi:TonB-dependent receptor domain-containing protein [Ectothiorhodospira variabilis]|uniref:TonB-dependent receptor domain-containing protein n=1 Tax=Ectothiorhodospira variabilis TaxID=505694 RepID=UPI001EFBDBB8|nr:TonB-dependent receptor [Ectothiorhodospira variabilis]MCG5496671.1 TonB-dependent receptor [Ectothiorhodospira variabilis]
MAQACRSRPCPVCPLKLRAAVCMAMGLLGSSVAHASETVRLDEITVTSAAGFEQKITDAPASISVITREELASRPYITLLDAVRDIEGVDVGETTDKTGQGTISMRGMGADYTLILIDGRRQNNIGDLYPNNFGGNQFNHIPPLEMIERIEVIRGPMSTLYGADAIGGVINIITRKTPDRWTGSITHGQTIEENSDFGNDRTTDFVVMGPLVPGKLGLSVRGNYYERDASNPSYAPVRDPSGVVHERTLGFGGGGRTVDNTIYSAGARLTFTPSERHEFTLDVDASRQKYDNDDSQLGTLDDYGTIWRASNAGVVQPRVGYTDDQRFTRDQWSIGHVGYWDMGVSDIVLSHVNTQNKGRSLPFTVEERAEMQGLWDAACVAAGSTAGCSPAQMGTNNNHDEAQKLALLETLLTPDQLAQFQSFLPRDTRVMETRQTTLDAKLEVPLERHYLVVGGQYIDAEMEDGVFGMYGDGFRSGTVQPHRQWAVFVEDNWDITERLTLTGGVRYDDHNRFGGQTSPRLYAVYTVNPDWTVKGGVSTGYKTPKASDLFPGITGFTSQGVNPTVGSPDLQPETSLNSELAVYFSSPMGHSFNATLFANRFKDKIARGDSIPNCEIAAPGERCADIGEGWAELGYTTFSQRYNIDRADIQGIELAGRYRITPAVSLRGNYTYTDSEQKSGPQEGRPLTGTAKHMLNATLDWQVNQNFNTFLTLEARSDRYRGWDTDNDRALYWKDYEILHLGAGYRLGKHVTLNGRINNLLDQDFTSYQVRFVEQPDGTYTPSYTDDYNIKAKSRNYWISMNVAF